MDIHHISIDIDLPVVNDRIRAADLNFHMHTVSVSYHRLQLQPEVWVHLTQTSSCWPGISYPDTGNNIVWQHGLQTAQTNQAAELKLMLLRLDHSLGQVFTSWNFISSLHPTYIPISISFSGAVAILSQVSKQASYTIALQAGRASSSWARGQEVCIAPVLLATEGGRQKSSRGTGGSGKDEQPLPPCLFHCQYE